MKKTVKKYIISFSIIILCLFIFSCKNNSEPKLVYTENDTIKQSVKIREQGITWSQEIEKERLTEKITRASKEIGAEVPYTKELFKISRDNQSPVYPEFIDFGSLDTRNLRPSLKEKMNNFCKSLSSENHSGADVFFSRKYIFNYVFFINDLEEGWEKYFNELYPQTDSDKKNTQEDNEKTGLFTKWTFGEPFIGSEIIQIPVRFYADCGTIDMTVFLNSSGNNEIYQITINRWKKV